LVGTCGLAGDFLNIKIPPADKEIRPNTASPIFVVFLILFIAKPFYSSNKLGRQEKKGKFWGN
jgi:hypothetical protein